ncbi:hypothetical protein AAH978_16580 [Streptomyces sp. ZYX-F-203]
MSIDLDHAIVRSTTTLVAHDRPTLREDDLGMAKPTVPVVTYTPLVAIGTAIAISAVVGATQ